MDERVHVDWRHVLGAVELLKEGGAIRCRDDGAVAVIAVVTVIIIGVVPKVPVACEITSIGVGINITISAATSFTPLNTFPSVIITPFVEKAADILFSPPTTTAVLLPENIARGHGEEVAVDRS